MDNSIDIAANQVTAIIGPSGCGKSTHIRIYNRIFELYRDQRAEGAVLLDGENILSPEVDVIELRRKVGMIFQKPTPFPLSIYENVAYGLRMHYRMSRNELAGRVEAALRQAALWDEVKDLLDRPGMALSGGQQQRLCIARAVAVEPEVILMDEPTAAIDPIADGQDRGFDRGAGGEVHDRHRHAQHAAGRAHQRLHRLLLPGPDRGVRADRDDLHEAGDEADGGLRHGPVRIGRIVILIVLAVF